MNILSENWLTSGNWAMDHDIFIAAFSSNTTLVIYCYITNYPQTNGLGKKNIYYLAVTVGQESVSSLDGQFWLKMFHNVANKTVARDSEN